MTFHMTSDGVIMGQINGPIPKESKVVRVFLSSTFTDMSHERNILMRETFPRLETFYRDQGLQFQVVDMRWGVREEAVLEHQTGQLCLDQIREAQDASRGVAFLALLGDKYGSCPLQADMSVSHFAALTGALAKAGKDSSLIKEWYRLDENAIPPHYLLLPRSEKEEGAGTDETFDAKVLATQQWRKSQATLQKLLQEAATLANKSKAFSEAEKHQYFMAVTESEISGGILEDSLAAERVVCVLRSFVDFRPESRYIASRFIDLDDDETRTSRNRQAQFHLEQLKTKKIPLHLGEANILRYSITPTPTGIDPDACVEHAAYLESLSSAVFEKVVELGAARIAATSLDGLPFERDWYLDLCHHLEFGRQKVPPLPPSTFATRTSWFRVAEFVGRRKLLVAVSRCLRGYGLPPFSVRTEGPAVEEVKANRPLIIHGPSGYGKTSVMARIVMDFGTGQPEWSDCVDWGSSPHVLKAVRFLGTSPASCNIQDVILSLIQQIETGTGLSSRGSRDNFAKLCEEFYRLLWCLHGHPLLVLVALDAVDQLSAENGAHLMHWLPCDFPANVHVVVSMLDGRADLAVLDNTRRVLGEPKCFIPVTELSSSNVDTILELYGSLHKRTLSPAQRSIVMAAGGAAQVPMCLRLAFDLTRGWRSFSDPRGLSLGRSVKELFNQILGRLEKDSGLAATRALQHITAARAGLSDAEIEDLLSLDDAVLQDVYIYHLPPESSVIRLPPSLWRRIRRQISHYLVEKDADGVSVVSWYHRSLWEAAGVGLGGQTSEIHQKQVEYFSGLWHKKPKPLSLHKGKKAEYESCQRAVPHMPWEFREGMGNLRKLAQLPYNTILTLDAPQASLLLTDFHFLRCKLRYQGLKRLRDDFRLFFATFTPGTDPDKYADLVYIRYEDSWDFGEGGHPNAVAMSPPVLQVKIVYDTLSNASEILLEDWAQLAGTILARLDGFWSSYPLISGLLGQCRRWLWSPSAGAQLCPTLQCVQPPGGLLRATINHTLHLPGGGESQGLDYATGALVLGPETGFLYAAEQSLGGLHDSVKVYDLENSGEVVQILRPAPSIAAMRFIRRQRYMLILRRRVVSSGSLRSVVFDCQAKAPLDLGLTDGARSGLLLAPASESFLLATHADSHRLTHVAIALDDSVSRVWSGSVGTSEIVAGVIAPSEVSAAFAFLDGSVCLLNLHSHTVVWRWGEQRAFLAPDDPAALLQLRLNLSTLHLVFTLDSKKLMFRGLNEMTEEDLFILDARYGFEMSRCTGKDFPLDIVILHKSQQWVAAFALGASKFSVEGRASYKNLPIGGVKVNVDLLKLCIHRLINKARLARNITIWKVENGEVAIRIKGNRGPYSTLAFLGHEDQFLAFSRAFDPGLVICAVGTPASPMTETPQLLKLGGHSKPICSFLCDATAAQLYTASQDNTLKIWDLGTAVSLCEFAVARPSMHKPLDRRKKKDQELFRVTSDDGSDPHRFVKATGRLDQAWDKKLLSGSHACTISLAKNERFAASGCMFGRLGFFDLEAGSFIFVQAHTMQAKRLFCAFKDDDSCVVSAAFDGARIWYHITGACLRSLSWVSLIHSWALVGGRLFLGSHSQSPDAPSRLSVWDLDAIADSEPVSEIEAIQCFAHMAVSADTRFLLTWNGEAPYLVDLRSEKGLVIPISAELMHSIQQEAREGQENRIERMMAIYFHPENGLLAVITISTWLILITVNPEELGASSITPLQLEGPILSIEFSRRTENLLVGRFRCVDVLSLATLAKIQTLESLHDNFVEQMTLVLDEAYLVTAGQDKKVCVWRLSPSSASLVVSFPFHCPLRLLRPSQRLRFLLLGPEAAGPLAVLRPNTALRDALGGDWERFVNQELFESEEAVAEEKGATKAAADSDSVISLSGLSLQSCRSIAGALSNCSEGWMDV